MAVFSIDTVVRIVTIHKDECNSIPKEKLLPCKCGRTGERNEYFWRCEKDMSVTEVTTLMNYCFWPIRFCANCYDKLMER